MCGIVGIYGEEDKSLIRTMLSKIEHRGPDNQSYFLDKNISLGAARLAIVDVDNGNQPIFNEDKTICTIFNGEIYNYLELKESLEKKGHKFSTNSDTEVIVHLYEEYKEKCLDYLKGVFSIAIWNIDKKELLLARDRLGIKPLYYLIDKKRLFFASEIKSLLLIPEIKKELNLIPFIEQERINFIIDIRFFLAK